MAQTNINVRMDEQLKKQFDELCTSLGLSMSVAINLFATSSVRNQKLTVSLSLDPFYSETNMRLLREAKERMDKNGGTAHDLIED